MEVILLKPWLISRSSPAETGPRSDGMRQGNHGPFWNWLFRLFVHFLTGLVEFCGVFLSCWYSVNYPLSFCQMSLHSNNCFSCCVEASGFYVVYLIFLSLPVGLRTYPGGLHLHWYLEVLFLPFLQLQILVLTFSSLVCLDFFFNVCEC